MIILTATEWNFVIEQTGISGNLEQFSFLHLSLQTYSNDWEDVRVAGNERGERLLEVSGLTLSAAQTDVPKASLHVHQWKAVQDRRPGSDSWGGRDHCWTVPPMKKPVLIFGLLPPIFLSKEFLSQDSLPRRSLPTTSLFLRKPFLRISSRLHQVSWGFSLPAAGTQSSYLLMK